MKKLGFILIGVIVVLLAAIIIIPSLVPSSVYKEKIETQLSQELGRDIRISGDVKIATFPVVKAKTGAIEIDNPDGFTNQKFITLNGLDARVKLLPLLSKRVEISRFTLDTPVIHLERNKDGVANWEIGDKTETSAPVEEAAPFARDGSMLTSFDPAISAFKLQDGTITYNDAVSGQSINVTEINSAVSLPSLTRTFKIDGSLNYDGTPVTLDIGLDSPRAFLDGARAALKGTVTTDFAALDIDGAFLASEAIDFEGNIKGDVSDMSALGPFLGENAKYIKPLSSTKIAGDIRFVDGIISAKNADLAIRGESLAVDFKGDASLGDTPVINGAFEADIKDVSIIKPFLIEPIEGLDQVETANIKAQMRAADKGFTADTLSAVVAGPNMRANFQGSAAYSDSPSAQGKLTANISNPGALAAVFAPDVAAAKVLGPTDISADITYAGENISAKNLTVKTASDFLSADFTGDITKAGEALNVVGNFNSTIPDAPRLANAADIEIKDIAAVKAVKASGRVQTDGKITQFSALDAALTGGGVNGSYKGSAAIGDVTQFDGDFTADIPSMSALNNSISTEIPYASAIGRITASGKLKGEVPANAIDVTGLSAELSGGQLNGRYKGTARYKDGLTLSGDLRTTIPNLRALAETTGTELPPNTSAGNIFEAFALSGTVTGTPEAMKLSNANVSLDKISGTGTFGVDLTQTKPSLNGQLSLNALDLRPYMESYSSQQPTGEIQPWSNEPLNLEALKAVNVDFKLDTPMISTGRITLGQTDMNFTLRDGLMRMDVPNVNLYGGNGAFKTVLNANAAVPKLEMDFNLKRLASEGFLGAVAGFTKATGQADTKISFTGQGISQAQIMKSLTGNGGFNVANGSLQGIDTSEFLSGLDSALTSRSLPGGIGIGKVTKFSDLVAGFSMENGVAKVQTFTINGPQFIVEGGGQVDLGNQTIDFKFLPKPTGSQATGLAQYGIPLRFSGPFGSASAGLDTEFLGRIVAAQAQQRAADLVKDQVGKQLDGSVGGILGGVLGGGDASSGASSQQGSQPSTQDAIGSALGGLLGSRSRTQQPTPPAPAPEGQAPAPAQTPAAPKIEDQIFDIFGKRDKKN